MKSMTGFGKADFNNDQYSLSITVKSLNQRFLDVTFKMPTQLDVLELDFLNIIKNAIKRGRLEIFINKKTNTALMDKSDVEINSDYIKTQVTVAKKLCVIAGIKEENLLPDLCSELLKRKETFQTNIDTQNVANEISAEDKNILFATLTAALDEMVKQRETEGANLKSALSKLAQELKEIKAKTSEIAGAAPQQFSEQLKTKISGLGVEVDPSRLAQEVAILATKVDITEELIRLDSHLAQFETFLNAENEIGKKFDFLVQEMGREINTIGSKAQNIEITNLVIDAKGALEKIREQIQNIE